MDSSLVMAAIRSVLNLLPNVAGMPQVFRDKILSRVQSRLVFEVQEVHGQSVADQDDGQRGKEAKQFGMLATPWSLSCGSIILLNEVFSVNHL